MHPDPNLPEDEDGETPTEAKGEAPARPPRASLGNHGLDIIHPVDLDDDDFDEDEEEDFEDEEDFDEEEDEARLVLITGASGHLAQKLRAAWSGVYDLILVDRVANPDDPDLIFADLSQLDEEWIAHFHGVDTVIHLAAEPAEDASWEELQGPNLDATANVLHACALAGVERVVFASSTRVVAGYRDLGDMPITPELPPRPDGPFGASKLAGERLGRSLARAFDITFIALRLGRVQPGENRPDTLHDPWARSMWLSNGDLIRLFDAAVEAELEDTQFVVLNGMSDNSGMRWDISKTSELLGYVPVDDAYAEEL